MATFSIQTFQTEIFRKGLAENNKFEMIIPAPPILSSYQNEAQKVSMFCEISNFPPLNMMVRTMNLYGPAHQRPVSLDYGGDGLAASFYLDREMKVKTFFDVWMTSIVNQLTHNVSYQQSYITNIAIRQLSDGIPAIAAIGGGGESDEQPTYAVQLEEVFPRSMNLVDLNTGSQNQVSRLTVVFAFRKWSYENINLNTRFNTIQDLETNRLPQSSTGRPIGKVTINGQEFPDPGYQ